MTSTDDAQVPVIDVSPGGGGGGTCDFSPEVAARIDEACRSVGFFTIVGHGVDWAMVEALDEVARRFFALPAAEKEAVAMTKGGRAWRGWFPLGGELTSGSPDLKEGLYFGSELGSEDPRVAEGRLLQGPNLFPPQVPEMRSLVLGVMAELEVVARRVLGSMAIGLGLDAGWFDRELCSDPITLFRIFHYPATPADGDSASRGRAWGVGEHTDYGLLTLLIQDDSGGLEVELADGSRRWVDVPPVDGGIVCNLGDMLDRMTTGRYRATRHRVRASNAASRLSFPYFFDPSWDAVVAPLPLEGQPPADDATTRWDGTSLRELSGTYGDYLSAKVARVFPGLGAPLG